MMNVGDRVLIDPKAVGVWPQHRDQAATVRTVDLTKPDTVEAELADGTLVQVRPEDLHPIVDEDDGEGEGEGQDAPPADEGEEETAEVPETSGEPADEGDEKKEGDETPPAE